MANNSTLDSRPVLSDAGLRPTHPVEAIDEFGDMRDMRVAGEFPLTIKVDDREVVTLMTLGTHPELLALGYLRNQRLVESVEDIRSITVDWERETAQVETRLGQGIIDWENKLSKRIVTTGCGQGTVFSCTLDKIYENPLPKASIRQSTLYGLLENITEYNDIYRQAGAVHGCALCEETSIELFVEDVGRHNAADTIAGQMWMDGTSGEGKIFYTTGRLTSEIVMKVAHMGIPILLSRSGVTFMGLELAQDLRVTMIARAKGRHFLVYNGANTIEFDQIPPRRRAAANKQFAAG
jgi:FdhD protein